MNSLRRAWSSLRSRSPAVQGTVTVAAAVVVGALFAIVAGSGGGSGLDQGDIDRPVADEGRELPSAAPEQAGPVLVRPRQPRRKPRPVELVERDLDETLTRVRNVFERRVASRSRVGLLQSRVLSARCDPQGRCRIVYLADGPGAGKALESQGPIWRELFSNPRVRAATLIADVSGPDVHGRGDQPIDRHDARPDHAGRKPVVVHCDRRAMAIVRDVGVDGADGVRSVCRVSTQDHPGV